MHGRQRVLDTAGNTIMNVAKISRIKSMSMANSFEVCRAGDKDDRVYRIVADMLGRTLSFYSEKEELVAVMTKTTKGLIMDAALGTGSENTIDIASGVDCSTILAAVFGVLQAGSSRKLLPLYLIRAPV